MKVKVTWLSPRSFYVGYELTNVFGRIIGKITATSPVSGYYRVEAELEEDLPLEVILGSKPMKKVQNE